jgi:rhamnosyltransferase
MYPKVAVLLASFNGERYINTQIESIANQVGVKPVLFISDDGSADNTLKCVKHASELLLDQITLLRHSRRPELLSTNSANNFYHLIVSVVLSDDVQWVAFSDQDDVWMPRHLAKAIAEMNKNKAQGYSSNVLAFWPNGTRRLVKKQGFISSRNHLFESPGPGCSIVLPRFVFDQLQMHLRRCLEKVSKIDFHDWAIFAYVRSKGGKWIIDSEPSLLYRQHSSNVLGVQLGFENLLKRFRMLSLGWYRDQVLAIASFCDQSGDCKIQQLTRLSPLDRLVLSLSAFVLRRRLRDKVLLCIVFLFMRKR